MDKFWKKWQQWFSKRGSAPAHIEGLTEAQCIAERFKMSFSEHSFDSYSDSESVTQLCARLRITDVMSSCSNTFSMSDIEKALACLKGGKASGFDNTVKEHLTHSHPSLIVYIMILFNIISIHRVVPDDFGIGTVVPIVQGNLADITDVNNYRGMTLCPTINKLFEYCLLHKYESHMDTNDVQFGF